MLTAGGYNTRSRANLKASSPLQKKAESSTHLEPRLPASPPVGFPELEFDDPTDLPDDLQGVVGMYSCAGLKQTFNGKPSAKTFTGKLAARTNEDSAGVRYPFGRDNTAFLAVYDGHGMWDGGKIASEYARDEIPKRLEGHKAFPHDLERALKETVLGVDQDLDVPEDLDGTTACGAILQGNKLTLFNVGDSRAVVGSTSSDGHVDWEELTEDHNADSNEAEMERIWIAGGRIDVYGGVYRPEDPDDYIGMTRSIGSHRFLDVGVIARPDVTSHEIMFPIDKVLIIATNGIWKFITTTEAVHTVLSHLHQGPAKAARALIEEARELWVQKAMRSDDITAIVVDLTKWREQVVATRATLVEQQSQPFGGNEKGNSSKTKTSSAKTPRRSVRLMNKNK